MNEIKIGDIVFLIHPSNIHTLEINKPYKVYHKYCDLIAIEGDFVDDYDGCDDENVIFFYKKDPRYNYYNEKRFKKDIRFERKLKLLQISKIRNNIL
jgi:hypothetical protein